jgi:hypothetical protein
MVLRVAIAVDRRGLGAKLFSAEHRKNSHPSHQKKNLDAVSHDVTLISADPSPSD